MANEDRWANYVPPPYEPRDHWQEIVDRDRADQEWYSNQRREVEQRRAREELQEQIRVEREARREARERNRQNPDQREQQQDQQQHENQQEPPIEQNLRFPRRYPPNPNPTAGNPYLWPNLSHITCHVCGMNGHYNKDCPYGEKKCYKCGQLGHVIAECTVPEDTERRQYTLKCAVCYINVKERLYLPCGHLCVCERCHTELIKQQPLKCPMCREVVLEHRRVFL